MPNENIYFNWKEDVALPFRLINAIKKSKYREIFLVSQDGGNEVYIPLKLLCIHMEIDGIQTFIEKNQRINNIGGNSLLSILYGILKEKEYHGLRVSDKDNKLVILVSRYKIDISTEINIEILKEGVSDIGDVLLDYHKRIVQEIAETKYAQFRTGKVVFGTVTEKIAQ